MPIRRSKFKRDCGFQMFVWTPGNLGEIVGLKEDVLGEVHCAVKVGAKMEERQCVRGACQIWQGRAEGLKNREDIRELKLDFEKIKKKIEKISEGQYVREMERV